MEIRRFKVFLISSFLFSALLSLSGKALAQSDSARVAARDSITYGWEQITAGWKWVSKHVGGDLFLSGEIYGLHLSGIGSLTRAGGPGAEIRVRPVFFGAGIGLSGDEGIPDMHSADLSIGSNNLFTYVSEYVGALIQDYRLEVGRTFGNAFDPYPHGTAVNFTTFFVGISRRFGKYGFIEPEIKIVFPIKGTYIEPLVLSGDGTDFRYPTEYYHVRDLFIAFSLKLGIGVN